jgi:hypothetical protein
VRGETGSRRLKLSHLLDNHMTIPPATCGAAKTFHFSCMSRPVFLPPAHYCLTHASTTPFRHPSLRLQLQTSTQTANMPSGQGGKSLAVNRMRGRKKYRKESNQADISRKQLVPTPFTTRSPRRRRKNSMRMTSRTRPSSLPVRNSLS